MTTIQSQNNEVSPSTYCKKDDGDAATAAAADNDDDSASSSCWRNLTSWVRKEHGGHVHSALNLEVIEGGGGDDDESNDDDSGGLPSIGVFGTLVAIGVGFVAATGRRKNE